MFSQQQAVVRVSTLFSSVRLAPPPTHGLQIRPAGLSLLLLPKGKPSATLQQCSYGLVLELQLERAAVASIHWAAEKGVFSETGLPVFRILGNWASDILDSRKLRKALKGAGSAAFCTGVFWRCLCQANPPRMS